MKKKIIISTFLLLIIVTAVCTIVSAIDAYNYDMDPANGVDIMEGFASVLIMMIGGFIVFYELDLFYTVYYFLVKPKTIVQSILNILSNLCLVLIFFADRLADILYKAFNIFKEDGLFPIMLFIIYALLRLAYLSVSLRSLDSKYL